MMSVVVVMSVVWRCCVVMSVVCVEMLCSDVCCRGDAV